MPEKIEQLLYNWVFWLWFRYYRGTHGVIIVYDVTNGESFANVKRWLHEIETNCDMVNKILVGNKNDDPSRKVVLTSDAQRFADQMQIKLFETSAKDNINVEEVSNLSFLKPKSFILFPIFVHFNQWLIMNFSFVCTAQLDVYGYN